MSALACWHAELAAGRRTTLTFDDLWRAACREAADRERPRPVNRAADAAPTPPRAALTGSTRRPRAKWELALAALTGDEL